MKDPEKTTSPYQPPDLTTVHITTEMKILILGAGKMGSFFCDLLSFDHEVAVYDPDHQRLRFTFNALRPSCIISDIASVKTGLPEFYATCGHPFVSTHPMFGPTFASLSNLSNENAIIISEGDHLGKVFFRDLYSRLHLNIVEYTFTEHDETIAYSLSIPFAATLAFAGVMKHQEAPGTTFKRHMQIARGLMSEDDFLVSEILFNPNTPQQIEKIQQQMAELLDIIKRRDSNDMKAFLARVREHIK